MVYQEQVMQIAQVCRAIRWAAPTCCAAPWARRSSRRWTLNARPSSKERARTTSKTPRLDDLRQGGEVRGLRLQQVPLRALRAGRLSDGYLRANYPVEFFAASMTLDMGNTDKLGNFRASSSG